MANKKIFYAAGVAVLTIGAYVFFPEIAHLVTLLLLFGISLFFVARFLIKSILFLKNGKQEFFKKPTIKQLSKSIFYAFILILLSLIIVIFIYSGLIQNSWNKMMAKTCLIDNDCVMGSRCGQMCYNQAYEDWYKETDFCIWDFPMPADCKCEFGFCRIKFSK